MQANNSNLLPLWIHCNSCNMLRFENITKKFYLKDCHHVACEKCKATEVGTCTICRKTWEEKGAMQHVVTTLMRNEEQYNKAYQKFTNLQDEACKYKETNKKLLTGYQALREQAQSDIKLIKTLTAEKKKNFREIHPAVLNQSLSDISLRSLNSSKHSILSQSSESLSKSSAFNMTPEVQNHSLNPGTSTFITSASTPRSKRKPLNIFGNSPAARISPVSQSTIFTAAPNTVSTANLFQQNTNTAVFKTPLPIKPISELNNRSMTSTVSSLRSFGEFRNRLDKFKVSTSTPKN